jgi:flagellar protein FlgJ
MRLPAASPIELAPPQGASRAGIEQAARELEAQFAQMLIKSMRSASLGGDLAGGDTRYRDMYDQQLARELGKGRGLGLAPMIMRQLERSSGGEPAPAAAGLPLSMPAAPASPAPMPLAAGDGLPGMLPLAPASAGVSLPGTGPMAFAIPAPRAAPGFAAPDAPDAPDATGLAGPRFDASSPEAFVQSIWPQAQKAAAELGVPAKALVAQAALETGWGRRLAGRAGASSMNLFGIKATGGWQGGRMGARTHEFVGGKRVEERADFRAYGSVAESFADYVRLIGKDRYASARNTGGDVRRFASALQTAGYATDPAYAAKITAIANGATLERALATMPEQAGTATRYAVAPPPAALPHAGATAVHAAAPAAGTRG